MARGSSNRYRRAEWHARRISHLWTKLGCCVALKAILEKQWRHLAKYENQFHHEESDQNEGKRGGQKRFPDGAVRQGPQGENPYR